LLFVYLVLVGRFSWPGRKPAGIAALVGILAHGCWLGFVLYAIDQGVPAGIVALVVALQPLLTGILSGRAVGEPPSLGTWIGLVLGFAGVGIAVGGRTAFSGEGALIAHLLPFGSVVAITAASLIQRKLALAGERTELPVDLGLFYQSAGTALAVSVPALFFEGLATTADAGFFAGMAWLVVAVSFASYALMWILIRRISATAVASLFYLGPPVTMLMAWIAFGDRMLPGDWLGTGIVLVGVLLAQRAPRRTPVEPGPEPATEP
jgi:drug/metabolite transporter (DMT)-like permease